MALCFDQTGAQGIPGGTAIYLEQIPSQLVVKNSNGFAYSPGPSSSHEMVRVSPDIDLDASGQMEYLSSGACNGDGFGQPNCVRFDIADNSVVTPGNYSVLPEQLQPFQVGRREAQGPPRRGAWQAGAVVWAEVGSAAARNGTAGWRCGAGGAPGEWAPFAL